ncbi:stage V sporulation protein D [Saccharococcus caldoxylosilyticus]|jgi:stage V sporulation protein D (sporulation-specific penicillin-binding protein)|uniref:Stage V sporulation protein D n=2 Tax=Saccharococcus caldoxylosilyticus TaxID=81408 RepID=A0A023DCJ1_9BACL|nr:stage V sporulation protein D [Parageobacillus caldoxylosilyticus]OQP03610.1 stage V sporulation protein D [Geobacillus sp. 44B]KYD07259.1 Cell division protein FtsI [Parageobacillus caldoxylosilyticus]MBB3851303.1 stage V sporulation protein D (sporulation-specific penicillin-binding protein) [Parageobacillus caldoxylosilyticus]QNU37869.1 stage V sporulation protein D [Geobacillus sp. 44B]QXJ37487.1 Stage V sporulation protein D [Parageobacillus caldoxylosilyticus]
MRVSHVTVRKRLMIVFLVGVLIFAIIDIRLGYVQFVLGDMLTERAKDSWSRNIPFEPKRGEILDRNGVPLATNMSAPTVYVIPRQIENPADTAEKLAKVLNAPVEKIYKRITKKTSIERIPEGRKISNEKAKEIRALGLKGVYIAEDTKRYYPFGSYLSHVLGFTGIDNQGLMGLELYYDKELSGQRGSVQFYSDAKGNRMPNIADEYTPPTDGLNLMLTIDSRIQTIVERELDIAEAKYNPDGIIAIAMNPNTGEILAMASRPTFDPANYRNVPPEIYNRNLPIWSTYEPGSTFKIITLAAALEEKKVNLLKDHFYDPGYVKVAGATLRCWKKGGHGSETFLEVVQNSCNPGFVELGQRLGKEKLFYYIKQFGFGEKTGIDLQGEGTGILFDLKRVGPVELATTAFGQGVSVTPIQQVAAVSAAVNGGILYTPYIAKQWVDPETGEVISRRTPKAKRRVISEETSKQVRYALESVVAQGTGKGAYVEGYRVGGKTGTAQKAKGGRYLKDNHIVSFIGFAPADDPQLVVYVAVDNPKGTVQFGGVVSAPIVGKIMEDSLRVLGVKPRKEQMEKERAWNDPKMIKVPNLIGLTKKDLQQQLFNLKLDVSGEGDVVVEQAPEPGAKVKEGATIRIYLAKKTPVSEEKTQ